MNDATHWALGTAKTYAAKAAAARAAGDVRTARRYRRLSAAMLMDARDAAAGADPVALGFPPAL